MSPLHRRYHRLYRKNRRQKIISLLHKQILHNLTTNKKPRQFISSCRGFFTHKILFTFLHQKQKYNSAEDCYCCADYDITHIMHSCTHSGHGNHNRNEEVCNSSPHIELQNCHCNDECACGVAARHTVGLAVLCKNRCNSVPHIRAFFFYDNSQKCYSQKHPRRHSQRL